jgi:carbamoyltransferase
VNAVTNPSFYAILSAYHRRTVIPSVLNTSFNIHKEPIVCTPVDAVATFLAGDLDYLALEDIWPAAGAARMARVRIAS